MTFLSDLGIADTAIPVIPSDPPAQRYFERDPWTRCFEVLSIDGDTATLRVTGFYFGFGEFLTVGDTIRATVTAEPRIGDIVLWSRGSKADADIWAGRLIGRDIHGWTHVQVPHGVDTSWMPSSRQPQFVVVDRTRTRIKRARKVATR
jgi:hypothetical protein